MAIFTAEYKGHKIVVETTIYGGQRLLVDGELQDETFGVLFGAVLLWGKIRQDVGDGEVIKIRRGGGFTNQCRIFVNSALVPHVKS